MTERNRLQHLGRQNGRLAAENRRLRNELQRHAGRIRELEEAKADLGAELEACDALLGAAMDEALGR